jgi:hypothetical protein
MCVVGAVPFSKLSCHLTHHGHHGIEVGRINLVALDACIHTDKDMDGHVIGAASGPHPSDQ